jgi:hypothetical protein
MSSEGTEMEAELTESLRMQSGQRSLRRRLNVILRLYSALGFLMAILAGGYLLFSLVSVNLTFSQQLALAIAGTGLALGVLSRSLFELRKERDKYEAERREQLDAISSIVEAWARFEAASKMALEERDRDINRLSPRAVISRLHSEGKIDESDLLVLENALQTRNLLVHGSETISPTMAQRTSFLLRQVTDKLLSERERHPA